MKPLAFSRVIIHVTLSPAVCEGSGSSTPLPTFGVVPLFNFSHSASGCGGVLLKKKLFMTLVKMVRKTFSSTTAMGVGTPAMEIYHGGERLD